MTGYWYVVHTYSGYEKKVKDNLDQRIKAMGMCEETLQIEMPTEEGNLFPRLYSCPDINRITSGESKRKRPENLAYH